MARWTIRANSLLTPSAAIALALLALTACSDAGGDTDPTVGSTSATTQATSTTRASTTTVDTPSTTTGTSSPTTTVVPSLDWNSIDSDDLVSTEKGGAFGVVLATGSNSWLAAGEVNDPDGVPQPTAWVSDDGVDWTSVDLPGPSGGAYVNTGAWSGERGILAGSLAGPEATTPGAVWLVRADGSAEEVDSEAFPNDLSLTQAGATTDGEFLVAGTSGDSVVVYRSPDGRNWGPADDIEAALGDLSDPSIVTIESAPAGALAVALDERGQKDVGVLLVDTGDGFSEVARLEDGADVDLYGAVVTGAQFQVYGAVRTGSRYEKAVWASRDGRSWERLETSVSISDEHTSYNTYGSAFVDASRSSSGLVGVIYDAAAYLFVTSEDGVTWTEAPITDQVLDTDIPSIDSLAASGDLVIATTAGSQPAMFRVTGTASQVLDPDLPVPSGSVRASRSTTRDDRLLLSITGVSRSQSLADTPDRIGRYLEVGLDGTTQASPPFRDLATSGVVVTDAGTVVGVGYEQFIQRFLAEGTIDPKAWRGDDVTTMEETPTGSAPEERTKRMFDVIALQDSLVAVGTHFPEAGTTAPIFWHSTDDGASWTEIVSVAQMQTPNFSVFGLCRLPGGGAMVVGEYDTDAGSSPAVWTTSDGTSWSLTVDDPAAFGAEGQVFLYDCEQIGDRVLVSGSTGAPTQGAVWETPDGSAFTPLELPGTGDDGAWTDLAGTADGTVFLLGGARFGATTDYALMSVAPDGSATEPVSLRIDALLGPTGLASMQELAVIDDHLVLVGAQSGDIKLWRAPLE